MTGQQATVLLVEDDENAATVLERHFARRGLTTDIARDGEEAVRLLGSHRYQVAVVDLVLPYTSGFYVIECIRKLPDPPVTIAITGSEPPILANIDRRIVKAILLKPIDGETFAIFVEAVNAKALGR